MYMYKSFILNLIVPFLYMYKSFIVNIIVPLNKHSPSPSLQMEALVELHDNILYYLFAIFFAWGIVIVTISLLGYYWALFQLFSDYFRILKDITVPGLGWALHNPPKPHTYYILPLQSTFRLFTSLRLFFSKLKLVGVIVFSRAYSKHLTSKLFTKKSACIVVSSIVISNMVRYFAIKYGIDTPLLNYPVLFSSATGISTFLAIPSKITIEMLFNTLEDNKLAIDAGEYKVIFKNNKLDTTLKMVNGNKDGLASNIPKLNIDTTLPLEKVEEIPDFKTKLSTIDNLLLELKTNINNLHQDRLKAIKLEINNQMDILKELSHKAQIEHVPYLIKLTASFLDLDKLEGFSDIKPEIKEICRLVDKDIPKPLDVLFKSNPEQYWKEQIKYANKVQEKNNQICKVIKDY